MYGTTHSYVLRYENSILGFLCFFDYKFNKVTSSKAYTKVFT